MITASVSKDHVPFGRVTFDLHPSSKSKDSVSRSLSEAVGDISIYDFQQCETWTQRISATNGALEELYFKDKTAVLSSTYGSNNGAARLVKTYTVQSKIQMAFWCSFLLPSSEVDADTGQAHDEIQTGFCIVESNMVTVILDDGSDYHISLPFHITAAWPLERGIMFQRVLTEEKCYHHKANNNSAGTSHSSLTIQKSSPLPPHQQALPIWFSMLHPLADLSPVICKAGNDLSYISDRVHHLVYISSTCQPYLAIVYNSSTKQHSMYLIRRTTPQEEKTYVELGTQQAPDSIHHSHTQRLMTGYNSSATAGTNHLTPSRSGTTSAFLTLSSVLSPSVQNMSPRVSGLGYSSLRANNYTASPSTNGNRLNPSLSINSPSLSAVNSMNSVHRSATASPSVSASIARSSFVSTGHHSIHQAMDNNMQADVFEPIRPDICLQNVWTDNQCFEGKASRVFISTDMANQRHLCLLVPAAAVLRCIKISTSQAGEESVIFGSSVNISAKDACPAPALNMILILDLEANIHIYSGHTEVSLLYVPRLSFGGTMSLSATPLGPSRNTVLASSRPGSAKDASKTHTIPTIMFDTSQDESSWSPVQQDLNDSTHIFIQKASSNTKVVSSLHSVTQQRLTMTLANGELCSSELPSLCSDPIVLMCMQALCLHLPYNTAIQSLPKWYLHNHLPGQADTNRDELDNLFWFILDLCGLPHHNTSITKRQPASPCISKKRARTVLTPSADDFRFLMQKANIEPYSVLGLSVPDFMECESSTESFSPLSRPSYDEEMLELTIQAPERRKADDIQPNQNKQQIDPRAPLSSDVYSVFLLLHLCYEELKLNTLFHKSLYRLSEFLYTLAAMLGLCSYHEVYLRDFPELVEKFSSDHTEAQMVTGEMKPPLWFPVQSTLIPRLQECLLIGEDMKTQHIYQVSHITDRLNTVLTVYAMYGQRVVNYRDLKRSFVQQFPVRGKKSCSAEEELLCTSLINCETTEELILLYLHRQGFNQAVLETLPFAVSLIIYEVIYSCQASAKPHWPLELLSLIKRQDLAALRSKKFRISNRMSRKQKPQQQDESKPLIVHQNTEKQNQRSGLECLDQQVLRMRWSDDLRVDEIKRCLDSSQPAKITLQQRPEVSDHQFIEEKQKYLLAVCQRTMALSIGRGMLTLRSHHPVLTESLHIPVLCLSGRSYPTLSSVELSSDAQVTKLSVWPSFHNGVAAGLCIDKDVEVDTSWILYNKPKVTDKDENNLISEHAGFLMALGLNGHLSNLARLSLHDYLIRGHEMTAVGILLGISATMRGTMDISAVRLLTIHVPSLLPPSTTQLDLTHSIKIAAIIGLGLVYQGSAHRHITGVLLQEIDHPADVSKGQTTDRESYSLSAGIALGMVMMGKGTDMIGLADLNIANKLYLLMAGGHRTADMLRPGARSGTGQVYEGEDINTDVTCAGATIALGLTYFNTNNKSVYDWMALPQSQYLLEGIRPDFLQLRIIARSLILWNFIVPSEEWIVKQLPEIVAINAFKRPQNWQKEKLDYETLSQAYCYIISGACFSIALKFAGSYNQSAYDVLLKYTNKFIDYSQKTTLVDQPGKAILENTICVCLVSLSMVMAGSGDLEILKICRYLRTRLAVPSVTYGSHLAVHLSLGLLCMGSGKFTLNPSMENIPLLMCSFFPKFPAHSNDNRYHLQALRHLYALAAEPKLLVPVDVDTGAPTCLPVEITLKKTVFYDEYTYISYLPSILPRLESIETVRVEDGCYWPIKFCNEEGFKLLRSLLIDGKGVLPVKRRSIGRLPSTEFYDVPNFHVPKEKHNHTDIVSADYDSTLYGQLFLSPSEVSEHSFRYISWRHCIASEKPELYSCYAHMLKAANSPMSLISLELQQFYLLNVYIKYSKSCMLSKELVESADNKLTNSQLINLQGEEMLKEIADYVSNGARPKSVKSWLYLSMKMNEQPPSSSNHSDEATAIQLSQLKMCLEEVKHLLSGI